MKIKQFFIDNKSKIKHVLQWFLIAVLFFVGSHLIYACGYYTRDKLDSFEELNKKELVNRKQSNNSNNDFEFKINSDYLGSSLIDSVYTSGQGNLSISLFSDIFLVDNGITFDNRYHSFFPNGARYEYSSLIQEVSFSDMDLDVDLYNYNHDMSVSIYVSGSAPIFSPEGSEGYIWQFDVDYEIEIYVGDYEVYGYFTDTIKYDIHYLLSDNIWFDTYDEWSSYFVSLQDTDSFEVLRDGIFYSGTNPFYFYNQSYNEAYTNGLYDSTNNLFQSQYCQLLIKQGYLYKSYGESDSTLGNGYFNKDLFFKGNHLDFTYLYEALRVDGLFQTASEFMITFDSNTRFYVSNLNLKVSPSSASPLTPVEDLNLQVRTSGQLGDSSELFEFLEYDKLYHYDNRNLITNIWFSNSWPDSEVFLYNVMTYEVDSYNKGFDSGYDKGYSNGYSDGEIDQDDYYNNLIIPAIKTEYEQLGYDKGYLKGQEDTLNEGSGIAMFDVFSLLGKGFEAWNPILNMQIIPGFTLGVFIAIPIIIGVVFIVIKLLQR